MDTSEYVRLDLSKADEASEAAGLYGLHTHASAESNIVWVHRTARKMVGALTFSGGGNEIVIEENCGLHTEIFAYGSNARIRLGGNQALLALELNIYEEGNFSVGEATTSYGSRVWVSNGMSLTIGRGCLISDGVTIRTTDHHTLFDTKTSRQLNYPKSVSIGSDVWIGDSAAVLKGVEIGRGSIIASHAVVTKNVPALELWGGVPAKRMRRNVSWVDSHPATAELIRARRQDLLHR